jgi:predicted nuclease of restriction endonuclease-like (RecB) superfamily
MNLKKNQIHCFYKNATDHVNVIKNKKHKKICIKIQWSSSQTGVQLQTLIYNRKYVVC